MTSIWTHQRWLHMAALFAIFSKACSISNEGTCVWRGNCGKNPDSPIGQCLGCYVGKEGNPPQALPDESKKILFEACPHFNSSEYSKNPKFCCTPRQIKDMAKGFGVARQLLDKCPTCYLNFRKNFCASTCSPVQSKFLQVSEKNVIKGKKEPCGDWKTIDSGKSYSSL